MLKVSTYLCRPFMEENQSVNWVECRYMGESRLSLCHGVFAKCSMGFVINQYCDVKTSTGEYSCLEVKM